MRQGCSPAPARRREQPPGVRPRELQIKAFYPKGTKGREESGYQAIAKKRTVVIGGDAEKLCVGDGE